MTRNNKMQDQLKTKINEAILDFGKEEGSDKIVLKNTDVVDALLEITGLYASIHSFKTYSRTDLAFKHALTIMEHIETFQKMRRKGKLPATIIPHSKVN